MKKRYLPKDITYLKLLSRAFVCVLVAVFCIIASACENTNDSERDLIRFHIRANSNSSADQAVKLQVRDKIVDFLEKESLGNTFEQAYASLKRLMPTLKAIADTTLKNNGFDYSSTVSLDKKYFPARAYGDAVIQSGYYDALVIELGSGSGDNWWCVVYPPLCYLEAQAEKDVRYKSKIVELIRKICKR